MNLKTSPPIHSLWQQCMSVISNPPFISDVVELVYRYRANLVDQNDARWRQWLLWPIQNISSRRESRAQRKETCMALSNAKKSQCFSWCSLPHRINKKLYLSHHSIRLQGNGLCDRRRRPCRKVTVLGPGFLNSTNMTCHVREFKVSIL